MTSPTARVFDNQSTSSLVNIGGTVIAWIVFIVLALSGLGLFGAILAAPFVMFGLTLAAAALLILAFPVAIVAYYIFLLLLLPFVWHKLD